MGTIASEDPLSRTESLWVENISLNSPSSILRMLGTSENLVLR